MEETEGTIGASNMQDDVRSDCTPPEELDLLNKRELLGWKFLDGGHRLPRYIPTIPHVDETEVLSSVLTDEQYFLDLATRLATDTKQVQQEYVYAKQKFDLLQQERDLLKWHLSSISKILKIKMSELGNVEARNDSIQTKLEAVSAEADRLESEKNTLALFYEKHQKDIDVLMQEAQMVKQEMEAWHARRGDYLADTTAERRRADQERKLRLRQWRKLNRSCNVDKKWHTKIEAVRNADGMIFDAYESASNHMRHLFNQAQDVTYPIRSILAETPNVDPLQDFVPTVDTTPGPTRAAI